MTPEAAKREAKEREGGPHLKARVRQAQRDIARRRMMSADPKAEVVVTIPTHDAVALSDDDGSAGAPRIVAMAKGPIALKIREIAAEAGVARLVAPPLADVHPLRTLAVPVLIVMALMMLLLPLPPLLLDLPFTFNIAAGLIVFAILVVINVVVVTKGAGLTAVPSALGIASAALVVLGQVPGMPHRVFLSLGFACGYGAWWLGEQSRRRETVEAEEQFASPP